MLVLIALSFLYAFSTANAESPEWVKDAIFYQIFPERFNNGDKTNDPTLESIAGSWPHDIESSWEKSPWTSDWYKLQPWEEKNKKGFGYNAQRRRYGGDIRGIIDKLDYLKELGINTIYLNPVFHSPSLHKYDAACYHHIDAYFGPAPENDLKIMAKEDPADPSHWQWTAADKLFLSLIEKAHQKNIRIILDGVFNHTGLNFWAFKDIVKNGNKSKYKDWYNIKSWDNPNTPENEFDYAGWVGVKELPELQENANGLIDPVKSHVFSSVSRWMDPNSDGDPSDGIDGWRLDVAEMVHHNFWKDFRNHVKSINPQAYITGEIFWEDWNAYKFMDPNPWLHGDQFDGVMNYRWAAVMSEFFIDRDKKITAGKFVEKMLELDKSYQPETRFQLLSLMDSHDTDRLASHIINYDLFYDKMVNLNDNPTYNVRKPNEAEWNIFKLIVTVQMTFPGAPMIYYGSEAGMWGADDPDERKPMVWPELEYEAEQANISKTERPIDPVSFNTDIFSFYKNVIKIRNNEEALRHGSIKFIYTDDENDILAYLKEYKKDKILCVVNNSEQKHTVNINDISDKNWLNIQNGKEVSGTDLQVMPKSVLILKNVN